MNIKTYIWCVIAFTFSACGGGGSDGGAGINAVQPTVANAYFNATPQKVTDLNKYYDSLCGGKTNIGQVIPVNLSGNGKKDLLITMWCLNEGNTIATNITPNRLVALQYQSDGSYIDKTKSILGNDYVEVGGTSVTYVVKDFNSDGYDDVVFAISYEDGRQPIDNTASNLNAQNTFLTSNGNGTYVISRLGTTAWNYQLRLVENAIGGFDVLSLPIGFNPQNNLYRYANGQWSIIEQEWSGGSFGDAGTLPLSSQNGYTQNQLVISSRSTSAGSGNVGLYLFEKQNSVWNEISDYILSAQQDIPWIGWNGSLGTVKLMTYQNDDYVSMNFEKMCEMKLRNTDANSVAVVAMTALKVTGGYTGQLLREGQSGLEPITKVMIFDVSLGALNITKQFDIAGQLNIATEGFDCRDVNGDSLADILIQDYKFNTSPSPVVLLGDGSGAFSRVDNSKFIIDNRFANSSTGYLLFDITLDGYPEFMIFPASGVPSYTTSIKLPINLYKGVKNL